jgi:hypothetical protein
VRVAAKAGVRCSCDPVRRGVCQCASQRLPVRIAAKAGMPRTFYQSPPLPLPVRPAASTGVSRRCDRCVPPLLPVRSISSTCASRFPYGCILPLLLGRSSSSTRERRPSFPHLAVAPPL